MEEFIWQALYQAGVLGLVLAWFMFRLERLLERQTMTFERLTRHLIRLVERLDPERAVELASDLDRPEEGA